MQRQASLRVNLLPFIHRTSTHRLALPVLLVAVLAFAGASCSEPGAAGAGAQEPGDSGQEPDRGVVEGVVMDKEELLSEEVAPQTYEGALVLVHQAVESGTYKLAADEPERTSYESGEEVTELTSGEDGYWQIDLEPGTYFVRAFYGDESYSADVFVEVAPDSVIHVTLELVHGV